MNGLSSVTFHPGEPPVRCGTSRLQLTISGLVLRVVLSEVNPCQGQPSCGMISQFSSFNLLLINRHSEEEKSAPPLNC